MNGTILVDGTNLIHRAYHVAKSVKQLEGDALLAGTVAMTSLMVSRLTHYPEGWRTGTTVVVFDMGGDSGRRTLFPEYKASRPELPDEVIPQATEALAYAFIRLGMTVYADPRYEADDVIATLHARLPEREHEAIVVSTDRDLFQLFDGRTTVRMPQTGPTTPYREAGEVACWDSFGVPPAALADYKALAGDTSDDVPGVRGIGSVYAQRVISRHGTLEEVYSQIGTILPTRVRLALQAGERDAYLYREVVRLRRDLPGITPLVAAYPSIPIRMG